MGYNSGFGFAVVMCALRFGVAALLNDVFVSACGLMTACGGFGILW